MTPIKNMHNLSEKQKNVGYEMITYKIANRERFFQMDALVSVREVYLSLNNLVVCDVPLF